MKKSTLKRAAALAVAGMMTATALAGCGGSSSSGSSKDDSKNAAGNAKNGKVYYLNFKPEQDKDWQALAKKYTDETGVEVTVKTAAEGTYESTLTAEMDKDNAPTLFQVNGPVGLQTGKTIVQTSVHQKFTISLLQRIMRLKKTARFTVLLM